MPLPFGDRFLLNIYLAEYVAEGVCRILRLWLSTHRWQLAIQYKSFYLGYSWSSRTSSCRFSNLVDASSVSELQKYIPVMSAYNNVVCEFENNGKKLVAVI